MCPAPYSAAPVPGYRGANVRPRLGQLLVDQKLITPKQLAEALRRREDWGTRLGTSLVRLGALDLDTLARALSEHYGVPPALTADFEHVHATALTRLPRALVEKHRVVPLAIHYGQGTRTLAVAVSNPNALAGSDELAFAAGMRVTFHVAPELAIERFMEQHFPDERSSRAIDLPDVTPEAPEPLEPLAHTPPSDPSTWLGEELPELLPSPSEPGTFSWRDLIDRPEGAPSPPPVSRRTISSDEAVELLLEEVADAHGARLDPHLSATDAVGRMALVTSRDAVGDLLLRFLRGRFNSAVVFVVANGHARGWRGFRASRANEAMGTLELPLTVASCLRMAYERRAPVAGPPARDGGAVHAQLWRHLDNGDAPREVLVAPILIATRVAALVYAQTSEVIPQGLAEDIGRVCSAAAVALARLAPTA